MAFKTKVVKVQGKDVTVRCEEVVEQGSSRRRMRFIAALEGVEYSHPYTIGPENGPVVAVTTEQLQKDIDAARQRAAEHAHFQHSIDRAIEQID